MNSIRSSLTYCRYVGTVRQTLTGIRCSSKATDAGVTVDAKPEPVWPERVVSGIQPTGELHVGNYFGALRRCVRLQEEGEDVTVFVADLHALTTVTDGAALARSSFDVAAWLLAAGLCPERGLLFVQSAVPRHAELCWALACAASLARLQALPQFRERGAGAGAGALLYPVLQAADVLLQRATRVPVGADQAQHLQLAAHLARALSRRAGRALFPEPRALLAADGAERLRSLRDPACKMSKSEPDPKSRVLLADADDVIRLKIRKAVTDFNPQVTYDPENRPGVSNLVLLQCLAAGLLPEEAVEAAAHLSTAQYKAEVGAALAAALRPLRERHAALQRRPARLLAALRHGAARARARADRVYADVADALGLATAHLAPRPAVPLAERLLRPPRRLRATHANAAADDV